MIIILVAAIGPLFVVLAYSFMAKGDYGDVKFGQFSLDGWLNVLFERDIFDDTLGINDAHLAIFWRSVKLSLTTTVLTLIFGFRRPISSPRGPSAIATCGCSSSPFRSG